MNELINAMKYTYNTNIMLRRVWNIVQLESIYDRKEAYICNASFLYCRVLPEHFDIKNLELPNVSSGITIIIIIIKA